MIKTCVWCCALCIPPVRVCVGQGEGQGGGKLIIPGRQGAGKMVEGQGQRQGPGGDVELDVGGMSLFKRRGLEVRVPFICACGGVCCAKH